MIGKLGTLTLLALLFGSGCSRPQQPFYSVMPTPVAQADPRQPAGFEGQFLLSPKQPEHPLARVRLVSVGDQGGTVLQHLDTRRYIHVAPGEFFVSEELGTNALKLVWASQQAQEAYFTHKWTE
jgi:hypothetical protein